MAEEKGRVLLFGRRWSGRTTLANMLVSGEIRDCPLNPTDIDSICKTYGGRGWTVIDTIGFGEPLDNIAPDKYAAEMGINFLNEVRGSYSHIIFMVDGCEVGGNPHPSIEVHRKLTMSMWKTFLEIFRGGEERFVILVTKVKLHNSSLHAWPWRSQPVEERFPECKCFLYSDFFNEGGGDDGHEACVLRGEALEQLEKDMKEMCDGKPWVEPDVTNMREDEIMEIAARITHQLASSLVGDLEWGMSNGSTDDSTDDSMDDSPHVIICPKRREQSCISKHYVQHSLRNDLAFDPMHQPTYVTLGAQSWDSELLWKITLIGEVQRVLEVGDEMESLGKEVKFYPRQCKYLLKRTQDVVKEIHDLVNGSEMNWEKDQCLRPLSRFISRLVSCMEYGKELLQLCGRGVEEEVVLAMTSRTDLGRKSFSKFALVVRDLEWSLDLFRLCWDIVSAEGFTKSKWASWFSRVSRGNASKPFCTTESEWQSWRSKFLWCEARCRLVYVGDSENGVAGTEFVESSVAGDNKRHADDQHDLISSMQSHFTYSKKFRKWIRDFFLLLARRKERLSKSERSNYMSVLKNRLQGDLPLQGDLTFQGPSRGSSRVPRCFQLRGHQEYKSIQLIGGGSYKDVFKCKWLGMNVALATSKSSGQEQAPTTDLEAEAEMLARVQHPNVVTLIGYSYDEEKQQGFLVTELLKGSLDSIIYKAMYNPWSWKRRYPFSIRVVIGILLQIVEAMIHVDECGVIYRDLKPENCLTYCKFDGTFVVKLIDLGTAELGSKFKTPNIGTPPWMAPEVYGRAGDLQGSLYTLSVDVYSFGMTCYQVITGNRPFGTMKGSALRKKVCDSHRPDIPSNCPDELRELMTKCWAHVAEDRPTFKDIERRLWNFKLDYSIWE